MRVRALDANGDMTFGAGQQDFLVNSPAAVGQMLLTRLGLWQGEWFLDVAEGTPWATEVLGVRTQATRDAAIRSRILKTQGVTGIASYSSQAVGRALNISATVDTAFGQLSLSGPVGPGAGLFGQLDFTISGNPLLVLV